jgi:hypothetical protein
MDGSSSRNWRAWPSIDSLQQWRVARQEVMAQQAGSVGQANLGCPPPHPKHKPVSIQFRAFNTQHTQSQHAHRRKQQHT